MRWEDFRRSENVEDRRGQRGGGGPGGGFGFPMRRGGMGIGTLIVVGLIAWALGVNPAILIGGLDMLGGGGAPTQQFEQPRQPAPGQRPAGQASQPGDREGQFASAVLAQTEEVWREVFQRSGKRYPEPKLVLFTGATRSACGVGQSAMGPLYCPLDQRVYLDLSFFNDLSRRFGAPGDFAAAYVIAHEVGHHVQNVLGILPKVQELKQRVSQREANALSVRTELQADCFAGVWAHFADNKLKTLEPGDIEEALRAAAAIGDDRLQRQGQGMVVPESFTHGSARQRQEWLTRGMKTGSMDSCDTFQQNVL